MTSIRQFLPIPLPATFGGTGGTSGVPTPANPTATAGPIAVNGSASTFLRSDGAPAIQKASNSQFGIVEVDGTTITASAGVISAVQPAPANPTATVGATAVNGTAATFMRSDAAPALAVATNTVLGGVKPDGTTITNSAGAISVTYGTTSNKAAQGGVITGAGPTGSATVTPIITYNSAGQLTTVTSATVTPAVGSVTGLGTGVATALGINTGTTGAFPVQTIGPWTPADASSAGLSFSGVSTAYTQIGNIVHAYGRLTFPSTVSASGAAISGLPTTSANANYTLIPSPLAQTVTLAYPLVAIVQVNSKTFNIVNALTGAQITNAVLSTATLLINVSYPIS